MQNHYMHPDGPSGDDEVGFRIIHEEPNSFGWPHRLPMFYTTDEVLAEEVLDRSFRTRGIRAVASAHADSTLDPFFTFPTCAAYLGQVSPIFHRLIGISSMWMGRPSTFLDYDAWIRYMVRVDDALEAYTFASGSQPAPHGSRLRTTRNSRATQYSRWILLPEHLRYDLAITSFQGL
jgi:hypothetical protein